MFQANSNRGETWISVSVGLSALALALIVYGYYKTPVTVSAPLPAQNNDFRIRAEDSWLLLAAMEENARRAWFSRDFGANWNETALPGDWATQPVKFLSNFGRDIYTAVLLDGKVWLMRLDGDNAEWTKFVETPLSFSDKLRVNFSWGDFFGREILVCDESEGEDVVSGLYRYHLSKDRGASWEDVWATRRDRDEKFSSDRSGALNRLLQNLSTFASTPSDALHQKIPGEKHTLKEVLDAPCIAFAEKETDVLAVLKLQETGLTLFYLAQSKDGGKTWFVPSKPVEMQNPVDTTNGFFVVNTTKEGVRIHFRPGMNTRAFYSADVGASWKPLDSKPEFSTGTLFSPGAWTVYRNPAR